MTSLGLLAETLLPYAWLQWFFLVPGYSWELLTLQWFLLWMSPYMCYRAIAFRISPHIWFKEYRSSDVDCKFIGPLLPLSLLRHGCNCSCNFLHIFSLFSFPFILKFFTKGKCFDSCLKLICPSHHSYDLCLSCSWMHQAVTVNINKWVKRQSLSKSK